MHNTMRQDILLIFAVGVLLGISGSLIGLTIVQPGGVHDSEIDAPVDFVKFAERVVLTPNEKLSRGQFVSSPSGRFQIGLTDSGHLELQELPDRSTLWRAHVGGCANAIMQRDGNFVLRNENEIMIWASHTNKSPHSSLVIDDGGRLSIMNANQSRIWMGGIPQGVYSGKLFSPSLRFPLRGIFYYPLFPERWTFHSKPAKFVPDLGEYNSNEPKVIEEHILAMEYAYSDVAIASWWGPGESEELSRISLLMQKTKELKSGMKWTVYYETEKYKNPSVEQIRSHLDYLKKWFVWHPAWAFINDKPVIFVYNEAGCNVNERWREAAGDDWYIVLKIFRNHSLCEIQPDSYHQYAPSAPYIYQKNVSSGVSPGYWKAGDETPKLPRLSKKKFCLNTKNMVRSGENWQLVTSFNGAAEGTLVEASSENWGSDTKYGYYLDCLHEHH